MKRILNIVTPIILGLAIISLSIGLGNMQGTETVSGIGIAPYIVVLAAINGIFFAAMSALNYKLKSK